jgi:hypothetical protein
MYADIKVKFINPPLDGSVGRVVTNVVSLLRKVADLYRGMS